MPEHRRARAPSPEAGTPVLASTDTHYNASSSSSGSENVDNSPTSEEFEPSASTGNSFRASSAPMGNNSPDMGPAQSERSHPITHSRPRMIPRRRQERLPDPHVQFLSSPAASPRLNGSAGKSSMDRSSPSEGESAASESSSSESSSEAEEDEEVADLPADVIAERRSEETGRFVEIAEKGEEELPGAEGFSGMEEGQWPRAALDVHKDAILPREEQQPSVGPAPPSVGPSDAAGAAVMVARTSIVMSFRWGANEPSENDAFMVAERLLEKRVTVPWCNEPVPLWQLEHHIPREVGLLNPQFQALLSNSATRKSDRETWACLRLEVSRHAIGLFTKMQLHTIPHGSLVRSYDARMGNIHLLLFPLGVGILVFNINWRPSSRMASKMQRPERRSHRAADGGKTDDGGVDSSSSSGAEWSSGSSPPSSPSSSSSDASNETRDMAMRHGRQKLSVDDVRALVFVSKYVHRVPGVNEGWTLQFDCNGSPYLDSSLRSCNSIAPAMYCVCSRHDPFKAGWLKYSRTPSVATPISLATIAMWLLDGNHSRASIPPIDLESNRYARHYTCVVLRDAPADEDLQDWLFYLRRAFGQRNRPPPNPDRAFGKVLAFRKNRYVGIAREGVASIAWPSIVDASIRDSAQPAARRWMHPQRRKDDFEVRVFPKKFQGIYLMLGLHSLGEKLVLDTLSTMAASHADSLVLRKGSLAHVAQLRKRLRRLATNMVRFTLSLSSNDCGGVTEYSQFLYESRRILGIRNLRKELSEEVNSVLQLVESGYLEEERRNRAIEQEERQRRHEKNVRLERQKQSSEQRMDTAIGALGAIFLPFLVTSAVFGMNNDDLPAKVPFWSVMAWSGVASILMLLILLLVQWRRKAILAQIVEDSE